MKRGNAAGILFLLLLLIVAGGLGYAFWKTQGDLFAGESSGEGLLTSMNPFEDGPDPANGPFEYTGVAHFKRLVPFLDAKYKPEALLVNQPKRSEKILIWEQYRNMTRLVQAVEKVSAEKGAPPEFTLPRMAQDERFKMKDLVFRKYAEEVSGLTNASIYDTLDRLDAMVEEDMEVMRRRIQSNPSPDSALVRPEALTVEWLREFKSAIDGYRIELIRTPYGQATYNLSKAQAKWLEDNSAHGQTVDFWLEENLLDSSVLTKERSFTLKGGRAVPVVRLKLKSGAFVYLIGDRLAIVNQLIPDIRVDNVKLVPVKE